MGLWKLWALKFVGRRRTARREYQRRGVSAGNWMAESKREVSALSSCAFSLSRIESYYLTRPLFPQWPNNIVSAILSSLWPLDFTQESARWGVLLCKEAFFSSFCLSSSPTQSQQASCFILTVALRLISPTWEAWSTLNLSSRSPLWLTGFVIINGGIILSS